MATLSPGYLAASVLARFSEPVLVRGVALVHGIVDLSSDAVQSRSRGRVAGSRLEVTGVAQMTVTLSDADVLGLQEGDVVRVRNQDYLVVDCIPDDEGLTVVTLMQPGEEPGLRPEWDQWR